MAGTKRVHMITCHRCGEYLDATRGLENWGIIFNHTAEDCIEVLHARLNRLEEALLENGMGSK